MSKRLVITISVFLFSIIHTFSQNKDGVVLYFFHLVFETSKNKIPLIIEEVFQNQFVFILINDL